MFLKRKGLLTLGNDSFCEVRGLRTLKLKSEGRAVYLLKEVRYVVSRV